MKKEGERYGMENETDTLSFSTRKIKTFLITLSVLLFTRIELYQESDKERSEKEQTKKSFV